MPCSSGIKIACRKLPAWAVSVEQLHSLNRCNELKESIKSVSMESEQSAEAGAPPPTTLMALPSDLIGRILIEVADSRRQRHEAFGAMTGSVLHIKPDCSALLQQAPPNRRGTCADTRRQGRRASSTRTARDSWPPCKPKSLPSLPEFSRKSTNCRPEIFHREC